MLGPQSSATVAASLNDCMLLCVPRLPRRTDAKSQTEEFMCGAFDPAAPQDLSTLEENSTTPFPLTYVRQAMAGGSPCVMTGQPRTAELWITCLAGVRQNVLVSVKEIPTCNYRCAAGRFICLRACPFTVFLT